MSFHDFIEHFICGRGEGGLSNLDRADAMAHHPSNYGRESTPIYDEMVREVRRYDTRAIRLDDYIYDYDSSRVIDEAERICKEAAS